jgi:F0F1-type ATP synthase epsilon subunit
MVAVLWSVLTSIDVSKRQQQKAAKQQRAEEQKETEKKLQLNGALVDVLAALRLLCAG